ncbi:MAG TPA: glycerate kinase [Acidimicrobiales bacterium]|nr:glycerate kinase [Acidimicrobiales bacterium]
MHRRSGGPRRPAGDRPLLLAAPDKFRGTASAAEIAAAACDAARERGWSALAHPLADGGEGMLEAVGGAVRHDRVHGPLGELVDAEWRLLAAGASALPTAVIEMSRAAGRALVGAETPESALRASTRGVGELIAAALRAGARRIVVGCGGSATTDGGAGALEALEELAGGGARQALSGSELVLATDVSTRFLDAARVFGPQKGATATEVGLLEQRLESLAGGYLERYGVDVTSIPGGGAAGGLAGGLAALGGRVVSGFELIAEITGLDDALAAATLVVTGEGRLDTTSLSGKVVSGVLAHAAGRAPVLVVAGSVELIGPTELARATGAPAAAIEVVELVGRFGALRSFEEAPGCVAEVVRQRLARR